MKHLILFIVFTGLILSTKAQDTIASGTCGNSLTWVLTKDSILSISGSGAMDDFAINVGGPWCTNQDKIKTVIIDDGVTTIGVAAFWTCSNLISVSIPNSVDIIRSLAFNACSSLPSVNIPYSVTTIRIGVFAECNSLLSIDVDTNNSRYSSNDGILYNKLQDTLVCCPAGKTGIIAIPNTVIMIDTQSFTDGNLTSVIIPNSVTTIGEGAFLFCFNLTSVTIPNSVITIEGLAFGMCLDLTFVSISESVTTIGSAAFSTCFNLETIICKASTPPIIYQNTFQAVPTSISVYIPCNTYDVYRNSNWKTFTNMIDSCASISEVVQNEKISVFPNPATNQLRITNYELRNGAAEYSIYSVAGQKVMHGTLQDETSVINVATLAKGLYYLRVGEKTVRFVKE